MKKLIIVIGMLMTLGLSAQVNSVGKSEALMMWDILGKDTVRRSLYYTNWCEAETLVVSVYKVLPDTLNYNLLYYFVDDVCIKQKVIRLKKHTWPLGAVTTVVDKVENYYLADLTPTNYPSGYLPKTLIPDKTKEKNDNTPNSTPKNNN